MRPVERKDLSIEQSEHVYLGNIKPVRVISVVVIMAVV